MILRTNSEAVLRIHMYFLFHGSFIFMVLLAQFLVVWFNVLDEEKASSLNQFKNSIGEICWKSPNDFSIVYI